MPDHPKLGYSIDEAVDASGSSRTEIYEAIKGGQLKARKRGRRTIILDDDLRDYLRRLPQLTDATKAETPSFQRKAP
jgi:Helix-turn-helix domain